MLFESPNRRLKTPTTPSSLNEAIVWPFTERGGHFIHRNTFYDQPHIFHIKRADRVKPYHRFTENIHCIFYDDVCSLAALNLGELEVADSCLKTALNLAKADKNFLVPTLERWIDRCGAELEVDDDEEEDDDDEDEDEEPEVTEVDTPPDLPPAPTKVAVAPAKAPVAPAKAPVAAAKASAQTAKTTVLYRCSCKLAVSSSDHARE